MVIYRKYRPSQFKDVVGQENSIRIFKGTLKRNALGHAYLFSGPRGTGKTTIARILAKAANCRNLSEDFEPCDQCDSCLEIKEGRSLDFIEIDAASNRGIDDIRQLREGVNFSPAKNKYRVFILDEAHMLTKEAFNALLKTLEEPPSHAIFILATTEIHKIPATIISRCQKFNFSRVPSDKIANLLSEIAVAENITAERSALDLISKNSEGCIRDAESIFGQIAMISHGEITFEETRNAIGLPDQEAIENFSISILKRDVAGAIKQIDAILREGKDLYIFTSALVSYIRSLLMLKISNELSGLVEKEYGKEELKKMEEVSSMAGKNYISFALKKFLEVQDKMRYSDFPNVYLELASAEAALFGESILTNQSENDNIKKAVENVQGNFKNTETGAETTEIRESGILNGNIQNDQDKTLKMVLEKWEEILIKIKEKNHSIHAFLKNCIPAKVFNGEIYIAAGYQFYKERLNTAQNRLIIESAIREAADCKLRVKLLTEKEIEEMGIKIEKPKAHKAEGLKSVENQEDLLSEALKMFGGQVVEA